MQQSGVGTRAYRVAHDNFYLLVELYLENLCFLMKIIMHQIKLRIKDDSCFDVNIDFLAFYIDR